MYKPLRLSGDRCEKKRANCTMPFIFLLAFFLYMQRILSHKNIRKFHILLSSCELFSVYFFLPLFFSFPPSLAHVREGITSLTETDDLSAFKTCCKIYEVEKCIGKQSATFEYFFSFYRWSQHYNKSQHFLQYNSLTPYFPFLNCALFHYLLFVTFFKISSVSFSFTFIPLPHLAK